MAGVAFASVCLSTAAHAQVLFSGAAAGCVGFVCVPVTSFTTLPGVGIIPQWATFDASTASSAIGVFAMSEDAEGGQNEDEPGELHFRATPAFAGIGLTVAAFAISNSNGNAPGNGAAPPSGVATPLTAHVDLGETSAVVANPEPMTAALTATGLLALGVAGLIRRRRRRSIA